MSIIELIPLNKGNHIILDNTSITTIGRIPNIGCLDNKISRNHAQLFIKSDGTLWIKPIHHNPTFYKTKTNQIVSLTKNKEYQLHHDDQFGLLPNEYFYRVSIKSNDEQLEKLSDSNQIINSSTVPKSPIKDSEVLTIENHDEEKAEVKTSSISDKSRALPTWMSNSSISTSSLSSRDKEQNKETSVAIPSVKEQTYSERKKTKEIVYEDDDDEPNPVVTSTKQASTSNNIDLTTNSPTSSSTAINPIKRERCPYGESCYRKNLVHRQQAIHPGDPDWDTVDNNTTKTKPECPYEQASTSNNIDLTTNSPTSSSTTINPIKRERCPYGESCYRKNLVHRQQAIHPGDPDWDTEDNNKTKTKPECPYGNECYRKNPDHLNEYHHPKKRCIEIKTKRRTTKRKESEDDDDGLPNEYDYNDSFIDDEDRDDSDCTTDEETIIASDDDTEWKPSKNSRCFDESSSDSSDDSEIELAKQEATEFIKDSTAKNHGPVNKKLRVEEEDDD
ncbi:unnamed protein product [Rotaria sp. Silwood1]|nr:unnamed protein product [Rotaria sp. Silwood1]